MGKKVPKNWTEIINKALANNDCASLEDVPLRSLLLTCKGCDIFATLRLVGWVKETIETFCSLPKLSKKQENALYKALVVGYSLGVNCSSSLLEDLFYHYDIYLKIRRRFDVKMLCRIKHAWCTYRAYDPNDASTSTYCERMVEDSCFWLNKACSILESKTEYSDDVIEYLLDACSGVFYPNPDGILIKVYDALISAVTHFSHISMAIKCLPVEYRCRLYKKLLESIETVSDVEDAYCILPERDDKIACYDKLVEIAPAKELVEHFPFYGWHTPSAKKAVRMLVQEGLLTPKMYEDIAFSPILKAEADSAFNELEMKKCLASGNLKQLISYGRLPLDLEQRFLEENDKTPEAREYVKNEGMDPSTISYLLFIQSYKIILFLLEKQECFCYDNLKAIINSDRPLDVNFLREAFCMYCITDEFFEKEIEGLKKLPYEVLEAYARKCGLSEKQYALLKMYYPKDVTDLEKSVHF